jgi:leucyl aminopeptidase
MKGFLVLAQIVSVAIIIASSRSVDESTNNKRLIQTSEDEPPKWMTESEIFELIQRNQGFMDVTEFNYSDARIKPIHIDAIPTTLRFNTTVQAVLTKLDSERIEQFLTHFSSYFNRYYTSATGQESQQWLFSQVQESVRNYAGNAAVQEIDHGWRQKSIVARLEGADANLKTEVVIIGAHLDSVTSGAAAQAPGADDNGSGTVVILEALRNIVEAGVVLNRTVEFHWYAAEEAGLLGSQAVAVDYKSKNVNVVGMLNLDVVGYYVSGIDEIAVYTDYANQQLVQLVRILTDGYLDFGRRSRTCGYGCSDHASWNRNGFPAVFVAEAIDSPYMHRLGDTIDTVNWRQLNEFVKLTVGFAVEMAEPVQ